MQTTTQIKTVEPIEIKKLIDTGYQIELIDVRTPVEYREVHAEGAKNIPLDDLDPQRDIPAPPPNGEPIYFICRSDNRGKKACEKMISAGHDNVVNVAGGTVAWEDLGLPVVRGQKAMSLERQVRIAAGSLVLLGVVLAWVLQQPAWTGLSAFVGAGLVFAGVTDSCGMAKLLARMPWNQIRDNRRNRSSTNSSCTK